MSDRRNLERAADRHALHASRRIVRAQAKSIPRSDWAYGIYLGVLLVISFGFPVVRAIVLELAELIPVSMTMAHYFLGAVLAALFISAAALGGSQTGPARASLPDIHVLHTSFVSRRRLLARPIARFVTGASLVGALGVVILIAVRVVQGHFSASSILPLILGSFGLVLAITGVMLLSQLNFRTRWALAASMMLLASLIGVLASLVSSSEASITTATAKIETSGLEFPVAISVLLIGSGLFVASIVHADRMKRDVLVEQAERWSAISGLALTGELRGAAARLGAPVHIGRHWQWRIPTREVFAVVSRDLRGILRTPARSAYAMLGTLVAGGAIGAFGFSGEVAQAGVIGAAAMLLSYSAIGPYCRGLRTAGEYAGSSPLLPQSLRATLMQHSIVPGTLCGLLMVVAALVSAGLNRNDPLQAGGVALALAIVALMLRILGAVKGPLPMALLAPVPTEFGDLSAVSVVLWSLDGVIWALLIGALVSVAMFLSWVGAVCVTILVIVGLMMWVRSRLRVSV